MQFLRSTGNKLEINKYYMFTEQLLLRQPSYRFCIAVKDVCQSLCKWDLGLNFRTAL